MSKGRLPQPVLAAAITFLVITVSIFITIGLVMAFFHSAALGALVSAILGIVVPAVIIIINYLPKKQTIPVSYEICPLCKEKRVYR